MQPVRNENGKGRGHYCQSDNRDQQSLYTDGPPKWNPPPKDWIKLNVDGSFVAQKGKVIFTAWKSLFLCASALEA
jgi:hypothetical protein